MGGLALCSNAERDEKLFAQSSLYTFPHHFLQRSAIRGHLYLEPEHFTRVKGRDRPHHGLGALRRMKVAILN